MLPPSEYPVKWVLTLHVRMWCRFLRKQMSSRVHQALVGLHLDRHSVRSSRLGLAAAVSTDHAGVAGCLVTQESASGPQRFNRDLNLHASIRAPSPPVLARFWRRAFRLWHGAEEQSAGRNGSSSLAEPMAEPEKKKEAHHMSLACAPCRDM